MKNSARSLLVAFTAAVPVYLAGAALAQEALTVPANVRSEATLCTDGKSHYVAVTPAMAPYDYLGVELFYGNGKTMERVAIAPPRMTVDGHHFLDPRYVSSTGNEDFRGINFRLYSEVSVDAEKKTCELRCGDRKTALKVVDAAQAKPLLTAAKFVANSQKWRPYALVRDDSGNYYYVEHGTTADTEKSFRLYMGVKGNLKKQTMTNVVSDSEGDIFATSTGSLRLILGKKDYQWIDGANKRSLQWVPVEKNMKVIYNELGIYAGQRLGTPCDDL